MNVNKIHAFLESLLNSVTRFLLQSNLELWFCFTFVDTGPDPERS